MEFHYDDLFSRINFQTCIIGITMLLFLVYITRDLRRNLLPGPWGIPGLGIIPFLGSQPQQTLVRYSKKYGPVFSGYLGSRLVVFVNDFKSMKQMFAKSGDTFNDRPKLLVIDEISHGKGLANGYLHLQLKEKRRFTMKIFRSLGIGKSRFENTIVNELEYIKTELLEVANTSVEYDPQHIIENAVSNIICGIVFGKRYKYDDPKFNRFLSTLYAIFEMLSQSSVLNFLPILRYIPGSGWKTVMNKIDTIMNEFIKFELKEHTETIDVNNPRDFIDEFLKTKFELENAGENTDAFDQESAEQVVVDLFAAGTETTASTLKWAILYLALNPDIQAKVYDEIESVCGQTNPPTLKDRPKLVYTEAVMMEVTRIRPAVPLGVPHGVLHDTYYEGHFIPKGTTVIQNVWAALHDQTTWQEPEKFKPERFIDERCNIIKNEELIPFSIGRRSCPGEQLARINLYLFFTHLVHQFKFELPPDKQKPTTEPHVGITLSPKPYQLIITNRN
ncbi:cytochrome P450 2U1-like [Antedon mediterranea]|uniref:cytochrome P450 2U1-like n=1 Tax=Antedon mediterranea TaxID=105859 RepID=UPI003AF7A2B2